jgi:hypothetical protein
LATIPQSAKGDGPVSRDQYSTPSPPAVQSIEPRLFIEGEFDRSVDAARKAFRCFGGIADEGQGAIIPVESGFLNYVTRELLVVWGGLSRLQTRFPGRPPAEGWRYSF